MEGVSVMVGLPPSVHGSEGAELRAARRHGWALAAYSGALLLAAAALIGGSPGDSGWWYYGICCLVLAVALGLGSLPHLLRDRPALEALPQRCAGTVRGIEAQLRAAAGARRAAVAVVRPAGAVGGFAGMGVTQARVTRAELTKLLSLRSTRIVLALSVVLIVGLSALLCLLYANQWDSLSPAQQARADLQVLPLAGVGLAQLAVGVLGVLTITSEYSSGMIRSSLTAVPRRTSLLRGKLIALLAVVAVVGLGSTLTAFLVGRAMLAKEELNISLGDPGAVRAVFGAPVYLALLAALGLALGFLLRSTALAICGLVGVLFILPIVAALLAGPLSRDLGPLLFGSAGNAFFGQPGGDAITSPVAALVVLVAWTGAALAAGAYRLLRQDS